MFVHGGGFQAGAAATCRPPAAHLALGTRANVLLPEYRLAPEHPHAQASGAERLLDGSLDLAAAAARVGCTSSMRSGPS